MISKPNYPARKAFLFVLLSTAHITFSNAQSSGSSAFDITPDTAPVPSDSALASESPYLSSWLHQTISLINVGGARFGPYKTNDTYLEYEYYGQKGPFSLYGYMDAPKVLGIGSRYDTGVWDKGSPLFSEQQPRISIDDVLRKKLGFGPFKKFYVAFDWIYDEGENDASRQNTLYYGLGTDIDTHTELNLSVNVYAKRQWENYGAANENTWDGYRLQAIYSYPLASNLFGGSLTYEGFFNWDFGSRLAEETGGDTRSDTAFVSTNVLTYSFKHLRYFAVARYFHNGGQWNGSTLNFGDGTFQNHSTGWAYYLAAGWQF